MGKIQSLKSKQSIQEFHSILLCRPRKRHESFQGIPRRSSLDQHPSSPLYDQDDSRARCHSLPRGNRTWQNNSQNNHRGHYDFWTGSLTRPKKTVKFDDQPPARPPPPVPERGAGGAAGVDYGSPPPPPPPNMSQVSPNMSPTFFPPPPPPRAPERQESLKYRTNPRNLFTGLPTKHDHDPSTDAYKDPWQRLYGKAVLDNTLQDRIEARKQKALYGSPTQQFVMEQDQGSHPEVQGQPNNPSITQSDYSMVRNIVLSILKSQGVPNPSDDVVDDAIREQLKQKQVET